jgi:hypothetical protein
MPENVGYRLIQANFLELWFLSGHGTGMHLLCTSDPKKVGHSTEHSCHKLYEHVDVTSR